jgi:probable HAF family extracellular repeat protein
MAHFLTAILPSGMVARWRLIGAASVLAMATSTLHAQSYSFAPVIASQGISTDLEGINAAGEVVGNYADSSGNLYCFTLKKGKYNFLRAPGASQTNCWAINKAGDVVGNTVTGTAQYAFVHAKGKFTILQVPNSSGGAIAFGISDTGVVVGTYADSNNNQHGFIYSAGTYQSFDAPGAAATVGISINTKGLMTVGAYDADSNYTTYLFSNGAYTLLNFPQGQATFAHSINNAGLIALGWVDRGGQEHGGLLNTVDGIYYIVDYPGASYTEIRGVNEHEAIVGDFALPSYDFSQGFTATGSVPKKP